MRYLAILTFTLLVLFIVQGLALRAVGGRNVKNESNFFSSLGRIQAGQSEPAEVLLLGSSLTGRLPDRLQGYDEFANMGCDGGSALDALRAIDEGRLPSAPVIVIEMNTLGRALDPLPSEVALAMERPWFQVGNKVSLVSAYARPSGFFYSFLLKRRIGSAEVGGDDADLRVQSRPSVPIVSSGKSQPPNADELIAEVAGIVRRLHQRGIKTLFVWLPPNRKDGSPAPSWMLEMVTQSNSVWWDLGGEADPELITLTDGAHMSAGSAARTVNSLRKGILSL